MTRGYLGSTPDGGIDDADREPPAQASKETYRQSLIRRLWEFQTEPTCPDRAKRVMAEAAQELEEPQTP